MDPTRSATPITRISSDIVGFDGVLAGGLPKNRLYLLEGSPGTGKTTFAMQFLLAGKARGESTLYITLSETKDELHEVAASHGWDLEGIHLFEVDANTYGSTADDQYTVLLSEEVELSELTQRIFQIVNETSPSRVVFDSVSDLRLLARDALRYRRQILAIKQFFSNKKCTTLLLDDMTAIDHDQQLQSIAHGVIRLERYGKEYGVSRRFVNILKMRGVQFVDGAHDYAIRRGGIVVFPRLVASATRGEPTTRTISSGVPALDALAGGGLDLGTSTLLLGPVGSGKSTVATQYIHKALTNGEIVSCYIFEESFDRFFARAAGTGLDLRPFHRQKRLTVRQIDPAEISPGEFVADLRHAVEELGSSLILIDSLSGYLNAMPNERFLLAQMHETLSYLNHKGVLSLLTMPQHGFLGQMTTSVDLSYITDTIFLLRYFEALGEVKQALSVIKRRVGPHERTLRELRIGSNGVQIGEPLRGFSGILTGVPLLTSPRGRLLDAELSTSD